MENLENDVKTTRAVYRDLFLKANDSFKKKIESLKNKSDCKNCRKCCEIRYSELSPVEILNLKEQGDLIAKDYYETFLPYGAFDYEEVSLEENNKKAREVNEEYVSKVLEFYENPQYFYRCRFLDGKTCLKEGAKPSICSNFPDEVKMILPKDCGYINWQKSALNEIDNVIARDILEKLKQINAYRDNFSCKMCGACCRLASCEYSFEELQERAKNGDRFSSDFVSIFKPYDSLEEARAVYPELVDMILSEIGSDENIYFYHCPEIDENNLCTDYENRPQICREFPTNPLVIFPKTCEFKKWKDETHVLSLLMHALVEISEFNSKKLNKIIELTDKPL